MRILYIASGIPVPGSLGGSTHTLEVARGLVDRGHELHVIACQNEAALQLTHLMKPTSTQHQGIFLHYVDIPKAASLLTLPTIVRLARHLHPDIIMERYYNFAGCGVIAAHRLGIPCLLEVNALIVDPPAVRKRRIDDALGGPMRGWAVQQCLWADRIVTPLHTTIPPEIERAKIVQLPWGAAVDRFGTDRIGSPASATQTHPDVSSDSTNHKRPIVVFLGSFRAWHGVIELVRAADSLLTAGHDVQFLLIGDGPERVAAEQLAKHWPEHIHFTGAVHYEQVPELLSQAVVGVAPFNTEAHPALHSAGFFWSPLKVYEYMAAELPVVTTDILPLNEVVRDGIEGMLFREGDVAGLATAIARLLEDPVAARLMGQRGRARVVANFSWAKHCEELELLMMNMLLSGCDHPVI